MLIGGAVASQINAYHDDGCNNYAYSVYTSGFSCQDIAGIECALAATSTTTCNLYGDSSCGAFIEQIEFQEGVPVTTLFLGEGANQEANSIACST